MDTNKYPINWRDLDIFPDWPTSMSRDVYQLGEDGDPYNTIACSVDMAFTIWPEGENVVWAVSPTWCPWGIIWDGVRLTDPALDPPPPPPPVDEPETPTP